MKIVNIPCIESEFKTFDDKMISFIETSDEIIGFYPYSIFTESTTRCILFTKHDRNLIARCDLEETTSYLKERFWLCNFSVRSEFQNKGYGSKFLQLLFQSDFCKGKRIALAFEPTPLRLHFYRKNMDMIVRTDGSYWYAMKDC